jgi:hypothetical protein
MLTHSQQVEWDQKVKDSLRVKKNADEAEAKAAAEAKALKDERKRLRREAEAKVAAEAEAKAAAEAKALKDERKRLRREAEAKVAAEAEAKAAAEAKALKDERKRLRREAEAKVAAEAEAKAAAEAKALKDERKRLRREAEAKVAAEAEAEAAAEAKAQKDERKRLRREAAAQAAADAKAGAVTVTEAVIDVSSEAAASAARKAARKRLKQEAAALAQREADALVQREADANEDALQPAPLNEAERLVDLDNAIEAEAVVVLQEETTEKKQIMMNQIQSQHENYGTAFEKVMLTYYQSKLKKMVRTTRHQLMEDFVLFDGGGQYALYDIVNNVCVCELKMFDSNSYRINVKTQSDIINKLCRDRDAAETNMKKAEADGDVEIIKTYREEYETIIKKINNPENYFKIQVSKFIGIGNYVVPIYRKNLITGEILLHDVIKNRSSILPTNDVGLKMVIWTKSGLYYYNIFDDPESFKFDSDPKSFKFHTKYPTTNEYAFGNIEPNFKTETSQYVGSDKNVVSYLIPINKLKFFKL